MKKIPVIVLLLFIGLQIRAQDTVTNLHFRDARFDEFARSISEKTGIRLFYNEKWVEKIRVNIDAESISVLSAVEKVLEGSGLTASSWHNDIVILPGKKLISALPGYLAVEKEAASPSEEKKRELTESEARYITGRKPGATRTIVIGETGKLTGNVRAKVLGRVMDEETGEPLISVPVFISETKGGAVTDVKGFFTLSLYPGKYNARVEYLGYEKDQFLLEVLSDGNLTVSLKKAAIQLSEVVVSGERQANIRLKDPGLDQVSVRTVKLLPMMMGEHDILKVSVTLPGILSTGEGGAGLNVRGGGSDQNAFYINNIPIYNTSHLFGFFSAFNSDIVKDFSIYKGHIPAQYGGKLASVFNITSRQGNRKHFTFHGGVSPVAGNLVLEGPLKKDTSSFLFSARSSYSDWLLSRIQDTTISSSSAGFNDLSGGVSWDFKKSQIAVFAYHSKDRFRLAEVNNYNYSNNGASVMFDHNFTNSLRGEFSFSGSQYAFSTIDKLTLSSAYRHDYKMDQYELRAKFRQALNDRNTLEYGAGAIQYNLDRGMVTPFGQRSLLNEIDLGTNQGKEMSAFISDSYDVNEWLNIDLGFRYTLFTPTGPSTVFRYTSGLPRDLPYISDTLSFGKNRPIKWYHEPDTRIAINFRTDREGSLKLAFNQMHQNVFMLNTTTTLAPNTQWKLADYHLLPSKSNQISAGVFRTLPKNGLEASLEIYYKNVQNYPEFMDGADFLKNPFAETSILQGNQKAYGAEIYIKRSRRKLEGWVSYTWSRSIIKVNGEHSWDRINSGKPFPSNYDIPHSLNMVLNYYFTRRLILSSIFTYQTGRPVTYPESVYYVNGVPYLDYSDRNAYHIPDYIRSDFSLTIEGNLKANKLLHSSLVLNLYNAAGRKNPYSVYFNTENGRIKSYKYSVVGVPIFTATWLFKLGNYASD